MHSIDPKPNRALYNFVSYIDDDSEDSFSGAGSYKNIESQKKDVGVKVYKRRWYLLAIFSFMILIEAVVYNTWSPICLSAEAVFNWKDRDIALLSIWGPLTSLFVMFIYSWMIDVYGLRVTSVISCVFIFVGTGLRCITYQQPAADYLINAGHILNDIPGVLASIGPSSLSVAWFPPGQRATATAISLNAHSAGVALSFLIGPLVVKENEICGDDGPGHNHTHVYSTWLDMPNCTFNGTGPPIADLRDSIMKLMYYECGVAALILILIGIYFPAKAPIPPSTAAAVKRVNFKDGLISLLRSRNNWLMIVAYSAFVGVYFGYNGVISVDFKHFNIGQTESGWIGFYSIIGGSISPLIIARLSDRFTRKMKIIILILLFLSALSAIWSVLLLGGVIPFSKIQLYASQILLAIFTNGAIPLLFEVSCETSYPIAEGVTVGVLSFGGNLVSTIFTVLLQVPGIGIIWMNWCLVGCCSLAFILMLFYKVSYTRLQMDSEVIVNSVIQDADDDD